MEKFSYNKDSLKIQLEGSTTTTTTSEPKMDENTEKIKEPKEEMSNRKALLIIAMLFAMYVAVSAIPTFVMMYFFDISFWLSQVIVIVGIIIVTFAFGLHKPASKEQKLKSKLLI